MHVLQTPVRFPPYVGGVESHVHDLSKHLVEIGHEVDVVCANALDESDAREFVDGVRVDRLPGIGQIANTDVTPTLPVKLLSAARTADVVHTHLPTPWSADVSALVGAVTGTPVVVTYHNDIVGTGLARYVAAAYRRSMLPVTLRLADAIVATQAEYVDRSDALSRFSEKVHVVQNGVETSEFGATSVTPERQQELGLDPGRATAFFLSVLDEYHEYKGLDVLLRAIARLADSSNEPPQLVIGGDGDRRSAYERQVSDLGIEDHVTFLGKVPQGDLPALYSVADLFTLPSTDADQEGFGLVALEALACETPVVTTDPVGVADDVEDLGVGVVVEARDAVALARGIERGLNTDFEMEAGRSLCERKYSWQQVAEETASLYADLL